MLPFPRLLRITSTLLGVFLGIGVATFHYAEGTSYLSADPAACANCHIMNSQYDSWQKSSHHTIATCVDCHLPHSFFRKYLSKAENGWNHSKAFTLQDFAEPIRLTQKNADLLQENCVRCHADLLHSQDAVGEPLRCVHCHRAVGHGPTAGLGGPFSEDELEVSHR